MAKMTYLQIEHARKRLQEIRRSVLGPSPDSVKNYTDDELYEAINDGKTVPRAGETIVAAAKAAAIGTYGNEGRFVGAFIEAVFGKEIAADKSRHKAETKLYNDRARQFNIKATAVEDAIVLGDCHEALSQLAAIADFTV